MTVTNASEVERVEGHALSLQSAKEPPGPAHTWNPLRMSATMGAYFAQPLAFVGEQFQRYGDIFQLRIGPKRFYFSRDPRHFDEVLIRKADAFAKGRRTGYVFRQGILVTDGERWRRPARSIQPNFTKAAIGGYFGIMQRLTSRLLADARPNEVFELDKMVSGLTLEVVCESLFAQSLSADAREALLADLGVIERSVEYFDPLPHWMPTPHHLKLWGASARIDRVVGQLLRNPPATERATMLSKLLEDLPPSSAGDYRRLRDQIVTMYFAGYRTSAHALVWTWCLLAHHPEVERRLHEEVDAVIGDGVPTLEHLPRLAFTSRVVNESMRVRPPSYLLERIALQDVDIGGFRVRRGSEVFLHIYWMQHDPRWYPEPHLFIPERPLENPDAYCPFGSGKRQCVGKNFALQEIVLAVAAMAQRFHVRLAPGHLLEHRPLITLGPRTPVPALLVPRTRKLSA